MVKAGIEKAGTRTLAELFVCYSNDFYCKILDVYDGLEYIHVYVADYTEHEDLTDYGKERLLPGHRNLKVEVHEPHRSYIREQWEQGHVSNTVYKFSNVRTKVSRGMGTLEATMWPDKLRPSKINIRPVPNHDLEARKLLSRKHDFEHPPKVNSKRKRQAEQKRARKAADTAIREEADRENKRQKTAPAAHDPALDDVRDDHNAHHPRVALKAPQESESYVNGEEDPEDGLSVATKEAWRACVKQTKTKVASCYSGITFSTAANLTHSLIKGSHNLSALIVKHLHQPSAPDPKAEIELRPLHLNNVLFLNPRDFPEDARESIIANKITDDWSQQQRNHTWEFDPADIPYIRFPDMYEAFDGHDGDLKNPRVQVDNASARAAFSPLPLASQAANEEPNPAQIILNGRIVDYDTDHISYFAQRLSEADAATGAKSHAGDRFNFWLQVLDMDAKRALWIWVSNKAAEKLLGMTATQVLEGREDGVARMRARLHELWGCLEFCKEAAVKARRDRIEKMAMAWKDAQYDAAGKPLVSLGVRALPIARETVDEIIVVDRVAEEIGEADVLYLLEDTHVVLGDM